MLLFLLIFVFFFFNASVIKHYQALTYFRLKHWAKLEKAHDCYHLYMPVYMQWLLQTFYNHSTSWLHLHSKLFKCTIYMLNYDSYYTLHPNVKFAINLDENPKFRV